MLPPARLERYGADVAEERVNPLTVVEHFDVLEHGSASLGEGREGSTVHEFVL